MLKAKGTLTDGHRIILNDFLNLVKREDITSILDAVSGRTSLSTIANAFPNTSVDAVVYPGDLRKTISIKEIADNKKNISPKKRNARPAGLADCCFCYWDGRQRSGTGQTVKMAIERILRQSIFLWFEAVQSTTYSG